MARGVWKDNGAAKRSAAAKKAAASRKAAAEARRRLVQEALTPGGRPLMTQDEIDAMRGSQVDRVLDGERIRAILDRVKGNSQCG